MENCETCNEPTEHKARHRPNDPIGYILESLGTSKSAAMNQAFQMVAQFIRETPIKVVENTQT